jgi:hypothetical protein
MLVIDRHPTVRMVADDANEIGPSKARRRRVSHYAVRMT